MIQEVIVVEGKHDKARVLACVSADVLVTNGTHLSKAFLETCKELHQKKGIIVFTDPDGPGNQIRWKINEALGGCKHAVLVHKQEHIGVEHASDEHILEALNQVVTTSSATSSLSWQDFYDLGLTGKRDSVKKRAMLSKQLHLPLANGKLMFQYLNMIHVDKKICERLLHE